MFDLTQISRYRENNQLEAKLATGGLPKSIWETYSAFANSYGGVILLGVEELCDRSLRVQGLLDPRELVDEFKTMLDDRRVVSANLLREEDIRILSLDGRAIVVIQVPPHPGTSCPSISEEIRSAAVTAAAETATITAPPPSATPCSQSGSIEHGRRNAAAFAGFPEFRPHLFPKRRPAGGSDCHKTGAELDNGKEDRVKETLEGCLSC